MSNYKSSPSFPRWRGLTIQLLVVTVLPLTILLLTIAFGSLSLHHHAMRSLVASRDLRAAQAAASAINKQLENRLVLLDLLANQAIESSDPQAVLSESNLLPYHFEGGLAFFSPEGELLASNRPSYWRSPQLHASLESQLPTNNERNAFFPVPSDPRAGRNMVAAALMVGESIIAAGAFAPDNLAEDLFEGLFSEDNLSVVIVDAQDRRLYQTGLELDDQALSQERAGDGIAYRGAGAEEMVIAFASIALADWTLIIQEPWQANASPMLRTTQIAPLILVPVLILALLALAFNVRQIIQPLQELAGQAQNLSQGQYQAIEKPVGGIAEIQHLQTELARMSRRVQAAQESLHSYIGAITKGQEEERRRLARDLHDDTLQALIALTQRIQLARMALAGHPAGISLEEIQEFSEHTIQNLRRLTRDLRPIYLEDLGLVTSLEILAQESGQKMGLPVQFQQKGVEHRLPPEAELALYRMVQEALSNIARHAEARRASLAINFLPESTILSIADDGCGFQVPESTVVFARKGHFGLLGMYERAELIGANLTIRSAPGEGALITIQLPN